MGAHRPQLRLHVGVQPADGGLVVEAARDAGLVRHHEHEGAGIVQGLDRLPGAGQPAEPLDLADIAAILVEDAVAVEEDGRPALRRRDRRLGPLEIARDADIDEEAV